MVKNVFVVGACIVLVGLGFFVVLFGLPLTLLVCMVLLALAFIVWVIYRLLRTSK
jgi:hypothetical protein